MLANRTSRWSIGAALLCIALLAASWFLLVSPKRADASTLRDQAGQADSQAAQLQTKIEQLKSEFSSLATRQAQLKAIKEQLPPSAAVPTFVRTMQSIAAQSGVSLDSLAPGVPAVVTAPGAVAPTTVGAGSLVSLPIGLTVTGNYFEASLFLKNLQTKIPRSYLVTNLTLAPAVKVSATATPTVVATPTATTTTSATPAPVTTPTPTVSSTAGVNPLAYVTMTVAGSVFVLLDGTVTLDDVAKQAKAAAKNGTVPSPVATGAAGSTANAN